MKIVFFEEAANLGGARIATVDLVCNLSQKTDWNVSILDVTGACKPFDEYCRQKNIELNILDPQDQPFIISSSNPIQKIRNILLFLRKLLVTRRKLRSWIKKENPDYIVVNSYRRLLYLFGLEKRTNVCFYAHGWYMKQQVSSFQRYLLQKVPYKIICVSEATKHALYSCGVKPLDRLYVVHNGIDIDALRKDVADIPGSENRFVILHCGGFTIGKGQHVTLDIARELKKRGFSFKIVFAGIIYAQEESKVYYSRLKHQVKDYHLDEDVLFVEGKSNVIDYFRSCDVLIHPSETEGLPLVVMEAMALKKPVIANSVGGVTDYIIHGYTGFLPNHNDVDEYVRYIQMLASDQKMYDSISNRAYSLVLNCYNVKCQIESIVKVFTNDK